MPSESCCPTGIPLIWRCDERYTAHCLARLSNRCGQFSADLPDALAGHHARPGMRRAIEPFFIGPVGLLASAFTDRHACDADESRSAVARPGDVLFGAYD